MNEILKIKNLSVSFKQDDNDFAAVKNLSFSVSKNEILGIVGESGSGKSVSVLSILKLLPYPKAYHPSGEILYKDISILDSDEDVLRKIRGQKISFIFQEPMSSLNPLHKIGKQISEAITIHQNIDNKTAKKKTIELLELVKIKDASNRYNSYPHELSGGQRQRVMIAIALANNPDILIADEPTTALDVTVQKEIIDLLKELQNRLNMAIIFITHDLGLIKKFADNIIVMKDGIKVEGNEVNELFSNPQHEYTKKLLASIPKEKKQIKNDNDNILTAKNIKVSFPIKKSFFGKIIKEIKAVDDISFELKKAETLAVVGESGSGKTTLANAISNLISYSGDVKIENININKLSKKELRQYRKNISIVFQDPYNSLNPKMNIKDIIIEGLDIHYPNLSKYQKNKRLLSILKDVGLDKSCLYKFPHEFSGGQRQRIAIARSLIINPKIIILDEPTSALDITIQSQIIELLQTLQEKYQLSYIFISHDMNVVKALANRIIVLKDGKVVEFGEKCDIFSSPKDKYTQQLINASYHLEI